MNSKYVSPFKFPYGKIIIASNVREKFTSREYMAGLGRHLTGDWGDVSYEEIAKNAEALKHGNRLFSAYGSGKNRFWIITEADRSVTTILLPEDF